MAVFKNKDNGSWYVMTRYTDWKGERKQKCKRGFATKKEATEWERIFHMQKASDLDMPFEAFVELLLVQQLLEMRRHKSHFAMPYTTTFR